MLPITPRSKASLADAGLPSSHRLSRSKLRRNALRPLVEAMERRCLLTDLSGVINQDLIFTNPNDPIIITAETRIVDGATLTIGPGVPVTILRNATLNVENGRLAINNAGPFLNEGGPATGIVVTSGGVMDVVGTRFAKVALPFSGSRFEVQAGGRLRARDSEFVWDQLVLANGSQLDVGDLANNRFDTNLSIRATDLHKLDNNRRFRDINILPGGLGSGQSAVLSMKGTETTANLRYVFPGSFVIDAGAAMSVRPSVPVMLNRNATLTVGGTLSVENAGTFWNEGGPATGIVVTSGGVMDVVGTRFAKVALPFSGSRFEVQAGGRLRARDSEFVWDQLVLANGSQLDVGDLANNRFDTNLSIRATDLHKLDNNRRFRNINILPGTLQAGESVELRPIGTESINDLRFVFPGNFTIASGAAMSVRPSVPVMLNRNATLTVGGTLSVENAGTFWNEGGPATGIVVTSGGVMDVVGTRFAKVALPFSGSRFEVQAGGRLSASGSTFDWDRLSFENQSTASLRSNVLNRTLEIHSGATIDITGNSIGITNEAEVFAIGNPATEIDLTYNYWGTSASSQIEEKITHRPDNDPATRPLVDFQPLLANASAPAPGVLVLPRSGLITTAAKTATFTIRLESQPTANVRIDLSSSAPAIGTPNVGSLTFTPQNWNVPQVVTIQSNSEQEADYAIITSAAISADDLYNGRIVADVLVRNLESSASNVVIEPVTPLVTTEAGGEAEFRVRLTRRPTANVTINLASSNPNEGDVSQSTLTFTTANWATPQTVRVTGKADNRVDGDSTYSILGSIASSDRMFSGWPFPAVSIVNRDLDTAEVLMTPTSNLVTTEAGGTATFSVRLSSQPSAPVIVRFVSSDPSEGVPVQSSLTFTATNWSTPQTLTVRGVNDDVVDGDVSYQITGVAESTDANFNGFTTSPFSIVNRDNNSRAIIVSRTSGLVTTEAGGTATFSVSLGARPTAPVVVDLTSTDPSEGVLVQSSLTFTAANWSIPQDVTIRGVDDLVDDGNVTYRINGVSRSGDPNFHGLTMPQVAVVNQDNDTAGVTLSRSNLAIARLPGPDHSGTFTVVLDSQPIGNVTFAISSGDPTQAGVDVSSITFTPSNWNVPRTVTVTGVYDGAPSRGSAFPVVAEVSASADSKYPVGTRRTVQVSEVREQIKVEGDYDGDGKADLALYHFDEELGVGVFSILLSSNGQTRRVEIDGVGPATIPIAGDFDGDGKTDVAVVDTQARILGSSVPNASVWTILLSGSNDERRVVPFGATGDLDRAAPADYDGDGITDLATFRPDSDITPGAAEWFILPSITNTAYSVLFGAPGGQDLPAPADMDGDGRADIVTFRPLRTALDITDGVPDAAQWFILPSSSNDMTFSKRDGAFKYVFGASGNADQPSVADFNNDGRADIVSFRSDSDLTPGSADWFILPSRGGPKDFGGGFQATYGLANEIAAVADYDGYGRPSYTVFNPSTGTWTIDGARSDGRPFGNPRTIAFDPSGGRAVPVLSPFFFRLQAAEAAIDTTSAAPETRLSALKRPGLASTLVDAVLPGIVSDS